MIEMHKSLSQSQPFQRPARRGCMRNLQNQTIAELDALMPSILPKSFRGEL